MNTTLMVRHKSDEGKWCFLTNPLCRGQLVVAKEARPLGMRMHQSGIVPYEEYRLATKEEVEEWLTR